MSHDEKPIEFVLPPALIGRADLARLAREVEAVDSDLETQKVKNEGKSNYHLPLMSQALNDFLDINKIDLADDKIRFGLKQQLQKLKDKAPVVHMTFATAAEPDSLQKLVAWVRQELHPQALVSVGLQPSLIGGVYLRTTNHVYDFSMKSKMQDRRDIIVKALQGLPS